MDWPVPGAVHLADPRDLRAIATVHSRGLPLTTISTVSDTLSRNPSRTVCQIYVCLQHLQYYSIQTYLLQNDPFLALLSLIVSLIIDILYIYFMKIRIDPL